MHSKLIFILVLLFSVQAFALEMDEKLTVRVLKTSETRKTILVNRGTEDGLVEGEHAKFYVTAGVVARAALVRISPTRSVWTVYRLVNADLIVNDAVMTLRITPAVKMTQDESKTLVTEDQPSKVGMGDPAALGIPLADGANDLSPEGSASATEAQELRSMLESSGPTSISEKNKEVFAGGMLSFLSAKTETDTGTQSFNGTQSYYHFMGGFEYYPQREKQWFSRFSLLGSVSLIKESSQAYTGTQADNDMTEFSVGANWHPGKLPSTTNTLIPFLHISASLSLLNSKYKPGMEDTSGNTEIKTSGKGNGFAFGGGYKYYLSNGFGIRAWLDYYMRSEKYDEDASGNVFNRTASGPRFFMSLGYRF